MTTLSASQVYKDAIAAGFSPADAVIAVQVAYMESGFNPNATHRNPDGSTDYGLMQINSVHKDLLASGAWSDPTANMRMAKRVKDSEGWNAWTVFKHGTYKSVKPIADPSTGVITFTLPKGGGSQDVKAQEPGGTFKNLGPLDATAESLNPLAPVTAFLGKLSNPGLWTRIGIGWLGFSLAVVGVLFLLYSAKDELVSGTVGSVVKGVSK